MKPDLSAISEIQWIHDGDWLTTAVTPHPALRYDHEMKGLCRSCPLACRPHPMNRDDKNPNVAHKLCTLTVIIAGFISIKMLGSFEASELAELNRLLDGIGKQVKDSSVIPVLSTYQKPRYIFGWMSAGTSVQKPAQLYVERTRSDWGVVYDPAQATRFKSIEAILSFYRTIGSCHGDVESNIYNGFLVIFEDGSFGIRPVPRLTRQAGLFDDLEWDQPDLVKVPAAMSCYSRDERKVVAAGFGLVRYNRDLKTVQITNDDPATGWGPAVPFNTYAAAERTLKATIEQGCIETGLDGKIVMSGWNRPGRLMEAGFEFYRCYGLRNYDTGSCIKVGSKNWSNLAKYGSREELQQAWDKLMSDDPKALEG